MKELIGEITNKLATIKGTAGINDEASLDDLNKKIKDLKSAAISKKQQIVLLYTYATDDSDAEDKDVPTFTWTDTGAKISDLKDDGWIPTKPDKLHNSLLYVRFVSVTDDGNAEFGIPIRLTGEKGEKGANGADGINAVALGASTIVKLYNRNEPDKDLTFEFDTDQYRQDGKILENIKVNNANVDSQNSEWTSSIPENTLAYEVTIKVTVDNENIDVLAGPICIVPAIESVQNQYQLSASNTECDEKGEWLAKYPVEMTEWEQPYLWSRIHTEFVNGYKFDSKPFLVQETQRYIKKIDVTYGVSNSVSNEPTEWSKEVPKGMVIWKKEITTFSDDTTKEVVCPMSIQGEPGIQYIGKFESKVELSDKTISYDDDFIGKIGVIINGETYVWYGRTSSEPNTLSDCEQIGDSWWLNLGNTSGLMIEILYDDLVKLRASGELIPGMQYRIIDYNPKDNDYLARMYDAQFDIIVIADTADTINTNARICRKSNASISKYEFPFESYSIKFDIVNHHIYEMIDENHNIYGYDFVHLWPIVDSVCTPTMYKLSESGDPIDAHTAFMHCKVTDPVQIGYGRTWNSIIENMIIDHCNGNFTGRSNSTFIYTDSYNEWDKPLPKFGPALVFENYVYSFFPDE